ncbi:hypothetical protein D557_2206 [Bordetella holmesii 70147]|nr:hypothetical protein D557_2206 [Bordetella holmesii 70147]KAK69666.1 hypothetical protein L573_1692 [Bordetella holmesii H620]KAK81348.1 hypothetical protein L503_0739 [Bordetella holmesii CDC-H809-BH]
MALTASTPAWHGGEPRIATALAAGRSNTDAAAARRVRFPPW